ncbi:hypothetical protein N234_18210 [Ralstonia pickettii DTP0602]|nr:hypothetical protein N234_18210 [Ralstonia pickettii DTP0602]
MKRTAKSVATNGCPLSTRLRHPTFKTPAAACAFEAVVRTVTPTLNQGRFVAGTRRMHGETMEKIASPLDGRQHAAWLGSSSRGMRIGRDRFEVPDAHRRLECGASP